MTTGSRALQALVFFVGMFRQLRALAGARRFAAFIGLMPLESRVAAAHGVRDHA